MRSILHGIGSYGPGARIGPANWPHHDLIVVTEGRVTFTSGGQTVEVSAGDAYLIPPGHKFHGVAGEGGAVTWVQHFAVKDSQASVLQTSRPSRLLGVAGREWVRELMRRGRELQARKLTTVTRRMTGLVLSLLLEEFAVASEQEQAAPGSVQARVRQAMEWAESQPHPTATQMAKLAGWSVNHFRERFQEVTGRTVGVFLRELSLGEAERLLRETGMPIKEIGKLVGYGDVIAFHHAFRQRFRMTPGRYRRSVPRVI